MLARGFNFSPNDRNLNMGPGRVPRRESFSPRVSRPQTSAASFNKSKRKDWQRMMESAKRKEQCERLSYVLIFRLVQKFGKKHVETITFFVEELINSRSNITAEDIDKLEKEVRAAVMLRSAPASRAQASQQEDQGTADQSQMETDARHDASARPWTGEEWKLISAYNAVLSEEDDKLAKQRDREKKLHFRRQLDEQISNNRSLQQHGAATLDDEQYAQRVKSDITKFEMERKEQYLTLREKNFLEREQRQKQIALKQQLEQAEREEARRRDEEAIKYSLEAIAKENEMKLKQRESALQRNERARKENEELKRAREEQKALEAKHDHQLMQEYAAKMDRETRDREMAFQKRMEENEARGLKFENEGAGKTLREERLRADQLVQLELERREAAEEAREKEKIENRKIRMMQQVNENRQQIDQRRAEAERLRLNDLQEKERARQKAEQFKVEEDERMRKYRESQDRYRALLDQQVNEYRYSRQQDNRMNHVEKGINSPIIRNATEDALMRSRVMHRMRHTKSAQGSRPKTGLW